MTRLAAALGYAVLLIVFCAAVLEGGARLLGLDVPTPVRPLVPYVQTGDFHTARSVADLAGVPEGPAAAGYRLDEGVYLYEPGAEPVGAGDFADFVFGGKWYARHGLAEVKDTAGGRLRIFVIGGSAAQGSGASGRQTTWHALLEARLRDEFATDRIDVFVAAMGAFVTVQERLVFDWAVAGRAPDLVIAVNGFNDVFTPLAGAVRPGDPLQMPRHYAEFYDRSWAHLLKSYSAVGRFVLRRRNIRAAEAIGARIRSDPALAAATTESVRAIYTENMRYLLGRCGDLGIECLVFLQPFRALTERRRGAPPGAATLFLSIYDTLPAGLAGRPGFHDLTGVFDAAEPDTIYTDPVHFNDAGQRLFAEAIFPPVRDAVRARLVAR